jgi:prepilin-type N-terminal cleavage/methylation domain-containing protein
VSLAFDDARGVFLWFSLEGVFAMRSSLMRRGKHGGMTLIEMVVVLAILAGLAGLLVPSLGALKTQSDNAAGAAGCAEVMTNLETYHASVGSYPSGMDSLLDSEGALISSLWQHTGGSYSTGLPVYLEPSTVTGSSYAASFGHGFGSGFSVSDHGAAADPSNSGITNRAITYQDTTMKFATVKAGSALAKAAGYLDSTFPTGVTLIALGLGPRCSAIGRTMASAPRYAAMDSDEYARYVAVFAVYTGSTPAKLKAVVSPRGTTSDDMVSSYKSATATADD